MGNYTFQTITTNDGVSIQEFVVLVQDRVHQAVEPPDEDKIFYLEARFYTGLIAYPIVGLLGLLGSILCVVVMSQPQMSSSTNTYLMALAMSDTVKVISDLLYFLVVLLVHFNSDVGTRAYNLVYPYAHYVFNASVCISAWLTVSVSMERYIYVCHPTKVKSYCSIRRARAISMSVFVVMSVIAIPYAFRYHRIESYDNTTMTVTHSLNVTDLWQNVYFSEFLVIFSLLHVSFGVKEGKYYAGVLCDLKQRINNNCSVSVAKVKTFNECVFKCDLDPACVGASTTGTKGSCFHHYTCTEVSGCSKKEVGHKYKSKNCAHGGVWNSETSTCSCASGWIGKNCLELPTECPDLVRHGYSSRRTYLAISLGSSPSAPPTITHVFCHKAPHSSWTALRVFKNDGKLDWNRTWDEYKNGFYGDEENYWIGLENWHILSKAGYITMYAAMTIGDKYRKYDGFRVHGESQSYTFTFNSASEMSRSRLIQISFGDCLGPLSGKPFMTKDKGQGLLDNQDNCAIKVGSGWWHDTLHCTQSHTYCNFLGKSPKDWGVDVPVYQRMRVDGVDPMLLEVHESVVGVYMYLVKP